MKRFNHASVLVVFMLFSAWMLPASDISGEKEAYGDLHNLIADRIRLWPGNAPHEEKADSGRYVAGKEDGLYRRYDVSQPELILIKPDTANIRDTVVIMMPGGGYSLHGMGALKRCRPILESGRWLAVLHYRVPPRKGRKAFEAPREDAARAIRYLRANAARYGFSPNKIGAMGFSAGANLAALAATSAKDVLYDRIDSTDDASPRIDFAILAYPAFVLGKDGGLIPDLKFDDLTPPMFLLHGDADEYSSMGSVLLYSALHKRGISTQLFVFANAGHGLGNAVNVSGWPQQVAKWLDCVGY